MLDKGYNYHYDIENFFLSVQIVCILAIYFCGINNKFSIN